MKPKSLRPPFKWDERKPMILDRVFYVPNYYFSHDDFQFPSWESPEVFGKNAKVNIEFCSGNGDWIIKKALDFPEMCWVAVEKRFDRVRKIWSKMKNQNVNNLFIVCGEGQTFVKEYLIGHHVDRVFINFPDPWPKDRHAKHRIVQKSFIDDLSGIMEKGAESIFVTDDENYSLQMLEVMESHQDFEACEGGLKLGHNLDEYGDSWFGRLWHNEGREIRAVHFKRKEREVLAGAVS